MDLATVTQTVSNLGFPIACVCAMFYFWNKEREQHEAECKEWMKKNRGWFEDAVIEYGNEVLSCAVHSNEVLSCSE